MIIANSVPMTVIHQGAIDGIERASSHAVTSAVLSVRKTLLGIFRIFKMKYSAIMAVILARMILSKMPIPKKYMYMISPGIKANITINIIFETLVDPCTKGD